MWSKKTKKTIEKFKPRNKPPGRSFWFFFFWLTDFSSHGKPHFRATRRQVVVVSIWCEISKSEKLHAATGHKPEAHGEAAVPCPCPSLYFFTAPVLKFACWFTRPSYKYITRPDFFYFLKNKKYKVEERTGQEEEGDMQTEKDDRRPRFRATHMSHTHHDDRNAPSRGRASMSPTTTSYDSDDDR